MKRNHIFSRFAFAVLLAVAMVSVRPLPARADAWGANVAASILSDALGKIQRQIEGVLLSALKTNAVNLLNSSVSNLIGGSTVGDSRIITDWEDYLYEEPRENTRAYMDSFLAKSTGGRNTSSYQSAGASHYSYGMYLQSFAKSTTLTSYSDSDAVPTSTMEEAFSDPETALEDGDLRAFNMYFSNPMNSPYGYALAAQQAEAARLEQEKQIQATKSMSHGYKSVESNGQVVLPGSTIADMVAGVQNLPNQIIASSNNPAELASGLIFSFANKAISNFVQKGIGSVASNIQREVVGSQMQAAQQLGAITNVAGTLAQYGTGVAQQVSGIAGTPANVSNAVPIGL